MRLILLAATPLAALIALPALADKTPTATETAGPAQPKQEGAETAKKAGPEAKKEKRICRYIRADAGSRRKTKICMTSEEWREANQGN